MELHHVTIQAMGIPIQLSFWTDSPEVGKRHSHHVEAIFGEWDQRFSRFKPDSELVQVNARAGEWVSVSRELFGVIEESLRLARETKGVFDPSSGGYLAAAGYGLPRRYILPQPIPTYRTITLDKEKHRIRCAPGQVLEPAAIVKGMAMDAAGHALHGLTGWMINAGGDILTQGLCGAVECWSVGIEHPLEQEGILTTIKVKDVAVATSGTYQTRWIHAEKAWHHQIDMESGIPATGILSVTVIAENAERADALSSIALLLGLEKGKAYLNHAKVPYLFVNSECELLSNAAFRALEI
jgi:thiamine biosynthesis lipoprotein